jgi:hypothetical protein
VSAVLKEFKTICDKPNSSGEGDQVKQRMSADTAQSHHDTKNNDYMSLKAN